MLTEAEWLDQLVREGQIKLEVTGGIPTWRLLPNPRHQMIVDDIRASIHPVSNDSATCGCHHLADVSIRFLDGSIKRPDIAIFCTKPPRQTASLIMIPVVVIEIVSRGYADKDLLVNPQWYLSQGVQEVVVLDPDTGTATHWDGAGTQVYQIPITLTFRSGCTATLTV